MRQYYYHTYEALHYMKSRQKGQKDNMVINLDISKAYEILEWYFLETMMRRLGFNEVWISRVMICVTTISYLILVNDQPCPTFTLTRGLYQRDPISPYLYLIYMEALSSLLNEAKLFTKIKGVIVAKISPSINHLFFSEDIIIFVELRSVIGKPSKKSLKLMRLLPARGSTSINLVSSAVLTPIGLQEGNF